MQFLEILLLSLYGFALTFILMYSFNQVSLVFSYVRDKRKQKEILKSIPDDYDWPLVTVQLPIYNELYVVERLIDTVVKFDYPPHKLEIQILDDSTDETVDIISRKVEEYKKQGVDIIHFRREDREGFKAGALKEGMKTAKGEFFAIFDADFIPNPDFLKISIPHFDADEVGAVQSKWGHINREYSLLTRLQAFGLDAHFSIEQRGRNAAGHFINFNGTAGVWRKDTIYDAGGWESDTLTEDLDLSYRAQLKGWKFKYLEDLVSPAELPAAINALKTQQFRWTKGAAEVAKKNLWKVLKAKHVPISTKIHATFHLMNSSIFVFILFLAILSIPLLMLKHNTTEYATLINVAGGFIIATIAFALFYWVSLYQRIGSFWKTTLIFIPAFPLFLSFSMGLSLHNAIAVFEGYLGFKSPFIRTPKFNIVGKSDKWGANKYINTNITPVSMIEGLLALYFTGGCFLAWHYDDFGLLPFLIMLVLGFGSMFFYSIAHYKGD